MNLAVCQEMVFSDLINFYHYMQRFADILSDQLQKDSAGLGSMATTPGQVGSDMSPQVLNRFRDEQIGQLYKLKLETTSYRQLHQTSEEDSMS